MAAKVQLHAGPVRQGSSVHTHVLRPAQRDLGNQPPGPPRPDPRGQVPWEARGPASRGSRLGGLTAGRERRGASLPSVSSRPVKCVSREFTFSLPRLWLLQPRGEQDPRPDRPLKAVHAAGAPGPCGHQCLGAWTGPGRPGTVSKGTVTQEQDGLCPRLARVFPVRTAAGETHTSPQGLAKASVQPQGDGRAVAAGAEGPALGSSRRRSVCMEQDVPAFVGGVARPSVPCRQPRRKPAGAAVVWAGAGVARGLLFPPFPLPGVVFTGGDLCRRAGRPRRGGFPDGTLSL